MDINKYLKKWKCPNKNITLINLLTHTSGSSDGNSFLCMYPQILYEQNLQLNIDIITGKSYSKTFSNTRICLKTFSNTRICLKSNKDCNDITKYGN